MTEEEIGVPPFDKLDKIHLNLLGRDWSSVWKPEGWRIYALLFVLVSGVAWIVLGYEACFDQIEWFGRYFIQYLQGAIPWSQVVNMVQYRYGIGTHCSAMVIYGLLFYGISKYYETRGIKGSLNLIMSALLTVFSISIFEFSWMASYYVAQQQFWVLIPLTKQASILYQNALFLFGGLVLVIFVVASPYRFRINKKLALLLMLSVGVWAFWYWYPLPQNQLAVNLAYPDGSQFSVLKGVNLPGGVYNGIINGVTGSYWCSFANFPQTMYTVNMNPVNPVGYGTPFLVEDNAVHTTNLLMKIVWAYTVFYFGKVVMRKHKVKYGSK